MSIDSVKLLLDLNVDARLSKEQCKTVMNHIAKLEKENLEIWAQFAKLQDVAEECSLASTKVEAITMLEEFNDGFVESQALAVRDLEQRAKGVDNAIRMVYCEEDDHRGYYNYEGLVMFSYGLRDQAKALKEKGNESKTQKNIN